MEAIFSFEGSSFEAEAMEYSLWEDSSYLALFDGQPLPDKETFFEGAGARTDRGEAFLGPFCLLLYQKREHRLFVTQHMYGDGKNLFFCRADGKLYLSSSLRALHKRSGHSFRIEERAVPAFITNGFVPGSGTLLEGVGKLAAGVSLTIDRDGVRTQPLDLSFIKKSDSADLAEAYAQATTRSIERTVGDLAEPVCLALSGGFDSNDILFHIKKQWPSKQVSAFSIGGVKGADETAVAGKIAGLYDGVAFHSHLVDPGTLTHLDEMVQILEGTVYERGIFLQYELGKILAESGAKAFVCGELADQVFHALTYRDAPRDEGYFCFEKDPWEMGAYVVLRKSRMTLNHFGIEARYPFVAPWLLRVGYQSREQNGPTKEYHKSRCREIFPAPLASLVGRHGGSTDMSPLFDDGFDARAEAAKLKRYDPKARPNPRYDEDPEEGFRDYYLTLRYLEAFERLFCDESR